MNILLIEDDPTDMSLFSIVLIDGGHSVCEKGSAEDALKEIQARSPELILVDLRLPAMDGLTLVRLLKRDSATSAIPVVAVTACPEAFSREAAVGAGCDAYLVKPVNTRTLTGQLEAVALSSGKAESDAHSRRR